MSLRARLLLGMGVIALVLGLAAAVIARTTQDHLVDQVDAQLHAASPQLRGLRPFDPNQDPEQGGPGGQRPRPRLSDVYVGSVSPGNVMTTLYAPDRTTDDAPVPELEQDDLEALRDSRTITVSSSDDDVRYRILAPIESARGGLIVVALPLSDVEDTVTRLWLLEGIAVLAVLTVLGLVTWWVLHLGIRPLRKMTATAGAIAAGDLSHRVPDATPGTETGDLSVALNGMLGRIEEAFDERTASEARLRQFIADASHELRTPVTTIRGYAELYRTGALDDATELAEAMRRTEQESVRMGTLVDELLQLARLDQGRPLDRGPVELRAVAADAVLDAQAVAPDRNLHVEAPDPVVVQGDEARLRQVVANLIGNALVHAPGASVVVRVDATSEAAVLEVSDDGPGLAPADAAKAFDRFFRADASRQRHSGGSGLGLSIVDATVRAHGGTVRLDSTPGQGTTVTVELPF